jgi:hypothetical protein
VTVNVAPLLSLIDRDRDGQALAVNLTFAVKLIFMPDAWRQFYRQYRPEMA